MKNSSNAQRLRFATSPPALIALLGCLMHLGAWGQARESMAFEGVGREIGSRYARPLPFNMDIQLGTPKTNLSTPTPAIVRLLNGRGNTPYRTVPEKEFGNLAGNNAPISLPVIVQGPIASANDCDNAQVALATEEKKVARALGAKPDELSNPHLFSRVWLPLDDKRKALLNSFRTSVSNFNKSCLAPYDRLDTEAKAWSLDRLVGTLQVNDSGTWRVFCSAFRISPNRIATARHCAYPQILAAIADRQVGFRLVSVPNKLFPVSGETCVKDAADAPVPCREILSSRDKDPLTVENDYTVLQVDTSSEAMPSIDLGGSLSRRDSVIMVGWMTYPNFEKRATEELNGQPATNDNGTSLWASRAGTCVVASATDVCIVSGCQSTFGTSGTSMFLLKAGAPPALVGIHVASAAHSDNKYKLEKYCDRKDTVSGGNFMGNVGRRIPDGVVALSK